MRDFHILQSILANALLEVRTSNKPLKRLQLALGEIAEIDLRTVHDHWQEISRGTPAERAQLDVRSIKAEVQCMACFQKYNPVNGKIHCPYCGSYGAKILSGEELYVESIEWDDSQT